MLGLGAATRIFVATGGTDMRLGFDGLYALVVGQLQQDPRSGHLFLFANKRKDRIWYRGAVVERVDSSHNAA